MYKSDTQEYYSIVTCNICCVVLWWKCKYSYTYETGDGQRENPEGRKLKKAIRRKAHIKMSGKIQREESALILTHSNIVVVKNVVRDKEIDKRKNFSGNSNDSFFLA